MHFDDVTIGLTAYCRRCSSIDLPTLGDNAMKRMLLWVATVTVFIVGAVLGASLLLWLSVGGTFFSRTDIWSRDGSRHVRPCTGRCRVRLRRCPDVVCEPPRVTRGRGVPLADATWTVAGYGWVAAVVLT